jgi:hypothetical protein
MKAAHRCAVTLALLGVAWLLWSSPALADEVVASQPWNGIGFGYCVDTHQSIASTFTPSLSGPASKVSVWLTGASVDRVLSAEIRSANADGSPTSTVLGSADLKVPADPSGAVHEDTGTFGSGPTLTAGTTYVLAMTSSDPAAACASEWSFADSGDPAWFARPDDFSGWQEILSLPQLEHQAFTISVAPDSPPDKPAAPSSDQSLNRDGSQTITWTPTTDRDGDAVDHYVLEHKRSDQPSFTEVAKVSGTSFRFGSDGSTEGEGTWTYRVIAVDSRGSASDPSDASAPVVVDKTAPRAPQALVDRPAAYTDASGTAWYRDSVTVSFTDRGDPQLVDGSPGSGTASLTPQVTFGASNVPTGTGAFSADGTASDHAGNTSEKTTVSGSVDWQSPTASFSDCPSAPVLLNSPHSVHWTAADPAPSSGLATPDSGSGLLDTSTPGSHSVSSTSPADNVGHSGRAASCSYTVNYALSGFLAPLRNPPDANVGNAGRTYPVKWQLQDAAGRYISSLGAVRSITYAARSCASTSSAGAGAVDALGPGGTGLRYDPGSQQYVFNWAAPSPGCYTLMVTFDSGQVLPAYFELS